jgi:hypothetical protein
MLRLFLCLPFHELFKLFALWKNLTTVLFRFIAELLDASVGKTDAGWRLWVFLFSFCLYFYFLFFFLTLFFFFG